MKTILSAAIGAMLALSTVQARAQVQAKAADREVELVIEQQSLADALNEWAKQTGLQLVSPSSEMMNTKLAPRIKGFYSPQSALEELLKGTTLTSEWVSERAVAIREKSPVVPAALQNTQSEMKQSSLPIARFTGEDWRGQLVAANDQGAARGGEPTRSERRPPEAGEKEELEEVIVTGTHIRGAPNQTAPVIVLDKAYIDSTGLGTTARLIESLPQNFALASQSGANVPGVSHSAAQGAAINLRGIGEGTTLTLLNGRRMALGFLGRAVDISALPLSAIEKVEVLTDGASAIYGSDAVGGVVNFILRPSFEGAETRLRAGQADGVDEYRASQALGSAWDSGNALLALEYYKRDLLRSADRDFVPPTSLIGSLLPDDETVSAVFTARQELTEEIEIFADALYTQRDSYNESGQVTFSESASMENPQLSATAGLGWTIADRWRAEMSGGYGRNDVDQTQDSSFGALVLDTQFEIETAQLKADGPIFDLPGGSVRVAVGLDWRSESFQFTQAAGGASVSQDFSQIVRSAFAELYVPIVGDSNARTGMRRLELSLAGRHDDYSTFGSSFDPRFGLMWEPIAGVRLRGSYGTSYVAPRLLDYDTSFNAASVQTFSDSQAPGGMSRQLWVFGSDVGSLSPQEAESSAFGIELAPASIPGLQIGLNYYKIDYEDRIADPPFPGIILENPASFGSLVVRDPTAGQVNDAVAIGASVGRFFDCEFDPIACSPDPNFDPASVDVIIDARRRNLSLTKTSGLDMSLQYAFAAAGGEMHLRFDGTRIFEMEQQATANSAPFDTVDTIYNPPDWRARGSVGFQRAGWAANLFVNHTDSYEDNRDTIVQSVGSYTTVDLRLAYEFGRQFDTGFLAGLTVSASAQNLFDRDPPRTPVLVLERDMGFDPTNSNPLGRFLALEVTKVW